jgi:hypothetical protein
MKRFIITTALIALAAPVFAEPRDDLPNINNHVASAHVGIVQSESTSTATANGGSASAQGGAGGAGGNATGGTAVNGGNSNSINIEGDEAAASSAYAGSQFAATICSGGAAFGIGAQTVGAGISLSFRGSDRFCQIREVAGDRAAIGYLASKDRHARKAFEMAGILVPEAKPSVSSKSAVRQASVGYDRCELKGRTLHFRPQVGADPAAALAACKRSVGVR